MRKFRFLNLQGATFFINQLNTGVGDSIKRGDKLPDFLGGKSVQ